MSNILWVALGGAIGSVLRYSITLFSLRYGEALPWGTLAANILGCFIIGLCLPGGFLKIPLPIRLFAITGFLGGLTTFSTFSAETWGFFAAEQWLQGFINITLNLGLSLMATGLGLWMALRFL